MAFDTEKLIREIKRRKAIWDVSYPLYRDRDLKRRLWEEITFAMAGVDNMTGSEMREFCTALQLKWKNIRTCFNRELKRRAGIKTGAAADRKTPYVYFEQLQFLKEIMVNNPSQATMEEPDVAEGSDGGVGDKIRTPAKRKKQITEDDSKTGVVNQNMTKSVEDERNQEESDPDTLFMQSLLKDFSKVPVNRRHSTKIELLAVLIKAQMPPLEYQHHDYMEGASTALPDSPRNGLTSIEDDPLSGCTQTSRTNEKVEKEAHIQLDLKQTFDQLSELSGGSWNAPEKILSDNLGIGAVKTNLVEQGSPEQTSDLDYSESGTSCTSREPPKKKFKELDTDLDERQDGLPKLPCDLLVNVKEEETNGCSDIGKETENELEDSSTNEQANFVTTEDLEQEPDGYSEESREASCDDEERCHESSAEGAAVDQGESPTRKKRKTMEDNGNDDKLTKEAFNLLKKVANRPKPTKDESSLFCELLCLKLRALDGDTREIAMHEISNLMFNLKHKK